MGFRIGLGELIIEVEWKEALRQIAAAPRFVSAGVHVHCHGKIRFNWVVKVLDPAWSFLV